ncbi:MAG: SDR family oxidoreductase [Planctomycetaceae bacterium]|nr:SDR family oxidoreductase [Planctomycetaceae bacterium]
MLVTGGAGFIGSHLVYALLERGDRVRVLDDFSTGKRANLAPLESQIELIEGSLLEPQALARAVAGVDCVFHEAALASVPRSLEFPLDTHAACATGTLILLDAARRAGVRRLVYAASSAAYGNQPTPKKSETARPEPISPYGAAKLAAEHYCLAFHASYGFEAVALRYFNVFGPRQDADSPYSAVIPLFVKALLAGQSPVIYGDGTQSRDFTFVANVVRGNLLAADAPRAPGKVINVAMGSSINLLDLLDHLQRLLGTQIAPRFEPPRAGDVRESIADISLAREILKYEPQVGFAEGLERSIAYYLEGAQ